MIALAAALLLAAPPPDDAFKPWFEEKHVAVSRAKVEGAKFPWIRGVADFDVPPPDVALVLADFKKYKKLFDPMIQSVDVLGTEGNTTRLHIVWPYPWPMSDRDAIVAYTLERRDDGSVLLTWKSDERKGDPRTLGLRIEAVEGRTEIVPIDDVRSRVTYTYYGDLGGDFGKKANEKAWKGQPVHYVESIRAALRNKQ